jgi:bla regulator protein BlaR1
MIAEAFAYAILVALLVGVGAASTEQVLAEIKRPRRLAWLGAYLAALAFPLLSMLLAADGPAPLAARLDVVPREAPAAYSEIDWNTLLLSLWAAATTLLLVLYSAAQLRLTLIARRWPRASSETGSVVVADDIGPAVLGIFSPRIVLPGWLADAPAAVRSTVVAHELEHIAARDQALIAATQLITILLPWNLPLWWFARRLRAAIEIDCDARVLRRGVDAGHYADVLLAIGQRRASSPYLAATLIEPVTQLERRIRIMLTKRRTASAWRMATAIGVVAILAACATQVDAPAVTTQVDAPAAAARSEPADDSSVSRAGITVTAGPAVARVRRKSSGEYTGEYSISAPEMIVQVASVSDLHVTTGSIVETPDGITFEDVRFEVEGLSITASRAVAERAPDGGMIVKFTNATAARPAATGTKLSE